LKRLVLFDFDGTLTKKDTLFEMAKFVRGSITFYLLSMVLFPIYVLIALGLISRQRGKEIFLSTFFGGFKLEHFDQFSRRFSMEIIPKILRSATYSKLREYLKNGDTVVVVSASPENWIKPWCEQHGITVIATRLESLEGKLTGRISGANCRGPEKVRRIKAVFTLEQYESVVAYGDSKGDHEMLKMADHGHYIKQ